MTLAVQAICNDLDPAREFALGTVDQTFDDAREKFDQSGIVSVLHDVDKQADNTVLFAPVNLGLADGVQNTFDFTMDGYQNRTIDVTTAYAKSIKSVCEPFLVSCSSFLLSVLFFPIGSYSLSLFVCVFHVTGCKYSPATLHSLHFVCYRRASSCARESSPKLHCVVLRVEAGIYAPNISFMCAQTNPSLHLFGHDHRLLSCLGPRRG